jgi:hypothetical protein
VTQAVRALDSLSAVELDAIATLWRRERRVLVTSFSGTSMLPAIAPGQEVMVQCGVDPAIGDVAVFRFGDQVGVHRVVARGPAWVLTWGDANPLPDEPIEAAQVMGVIRNPPAGPRSLRRALLLRWLVSRAAPVDALTWRVRLVYHIRAVWGKGPRVFAGTTLRALFRRLSLR